MMEKQNIPLFMTPGFLDKLKTLEEHQNILSKSIEYLYILKTKIMLLEGKIELMEIHEKRITKKNKSKSAFYVG